MMLNKNNLNYLKNIKTLFVNRDMMSSLLCICRHKLDKMLVDIFGVQPFFYKKLGKAREWAVSPRVLDAFIHNHSMFKDNRFMFFKFKTWKKVYKSKKKVVSVFITEDAVALSNVEKQYVLEWWAKLSKKKRFAILDKFHV
jgi:hypothetical protein